MRPSTEILSARKTRPLEEEGLVRRFCLIFLSASAAATWGFFAAGVAFYILFKKKKSNYNH